MAEIVALNLECHPMECVKTTSMEKDVQECLEENIIGDVKIRQIKVLSHADMLR